MDGQDNPYWGTLLLEIFVQHGLPKPGCLNDQGFTLFTALLFLLHSRTPTTPFAGYSHKSGAPNNRCDYPPARPVGDLLRHRPPLRRCHLPRQFARAGGDGTEHARDGRGNDDDRRGAIAQ